MRVVQVANFYGPRSGGLRTAVDRLGAEYCAGGHEVFLIVPGQRAERSRLHTGVVRITMPAWLIPFTGGYRAVMPGPVKALLEALRPDALEVSDRLTLRSLGRWGREHGATTVMISHERLDRLAGQILPHRAAVSSPILPTPHRGRLRHRGVYHRFRPRGIRSHRRDEHRHGAAGRGPEDLSPEPALVPGAAAMGHTQHSSCWSIAAGCRWKSGWTAASTQWRVVPLRGRCPARRHGRGADAGQAAAAGRPVADRLHRFRLQPGYRRRAAGLGGRHAGARAARDIRAGRAGIAGLRDAGGGLAHLGVDRDHHPDSGASADNHPEAIARAVSAVISLPNTTAASPHGAARRTSPGSGRRRACWLVGAHRIALGCTHCR